MHNEETHGEGRGHSSHHHVSASRKEGGAVPNDRCCNAAHEDMPPIPNQAGKYFWSVAVPGKCQAATGKNCENGGGSKTNVTIHEYVTVQGPQGIVVVATGNKDVKEVSACTGDAC